MSLATGNNYAGNLSAQQSYDALRSSGALLVDVRTKAEWAYVGIPDLSELGGEPVFLEWQMFPDMNVNNQFVDILSNELNRRTLGPDTELLFLCRSGVRSAAAAGAMTLAGYHKCYNVTGGFEGPADDKRHRGQVDGWKAVGLPWIQS